MFGWRKKGKKGFTLIEAVVSVLILGTTVASIVGVFMTGCVSIAMAKHHIEAMNHARSAMEQYINNQTTYTLPDGDIKNLSGSCVVTPTAYATGIKKIVVTISWNERSSGSSKRVSEQLVTLAMD